ncbi:MAG TPA: SRPBCC family protein [Candidatus Dormibacteraeota bacterium]|nr:SRPBCC family protein [Candidatus Dormibacteraeota bacterium]
MAFHVFEREQVLDLPQRDVFRFFSDAGNLRLITPAALAFKFEEPPPDQLEVGSEIRYRIKVAGIPVRWTTRIREWDPPHRFADLQARGPYAYWLHTHTFSEIDGGRTLMRDRVIYRVPFGPVGEVARRVFVEPQLKLIFDYRENAFGPAIRGEAPPQLPLGASIPGGIPAIAGVGAAAALIAAAMIWRRARSS